ncbi:MAG: carbonic anhydrase family protein [Chloroflexi bacterium]|nr:carbonic anhydrase family protein [Chloroflexota bacterium]
MQTGSSRGGYLSPRGGKYGFTSVRDHLPEEQIGIIATGATVQVADLLPTEQTVYRYSGSLTTPPCSEEVIWSVMKTPVEMSAEQIADFNHIIAGNNRPLQPVIEQGLQLDGTP